MSLGHSLIVPFNVFSFLFLFSFQQYYRHDDSHTQFYNLLLFTIMSDWQKVMSNYLYRQKIIYYNLRIAQVNKSWNCMSN